MCLINDLIYLDQGIIMSEEASLIERMQGYRDSEYSEDTHTKSIMAMKYLTDGQDFINRVVLLSNKDSYATKSFNAKIYVDFINAVECCLKSVFISLSKTEESPENTYKKLRKKSHNIEKLRQSIDGKGEQRFREFSELFSVLEKLNVKLRYSVELVALYQALGSDYVSEESKILHKRDQIKKHLKDLLKIYDISDEIYSDNLSKFRASRLSQSAVIIDRITVMLS